MVTARRAMANGANVKPAIQELLSAATDLAELHGTTMSDAAPAAPSDARAPNVTKAVTEKVRPSRQRKPVDAAPDDVTANADVPERPTLPPAVNPREALDPAAVRMDRIPSRVDDKRSKMVLVGHGDDTRLVGFLEPEGIQQKKWDAFAPGWFRLDGGPFKTRQEALTRLLYPHVPFNVRRGRKRRSS